MEKLHRIERHVRRGLHSLCDSLYQEWPLPSADARNEISEANLAVHLSHEFLSQNFCVFAEYRTGMNEHYDLVLFHPELPEYIIIECKRFLKPDGSGLNSDFIRTLGQADLKPAIGIMVTMTRYKCIRDWWLDINREISPDGKRSPRWEQLASLLTESRSIVGHVPMPHHGDGASSNDDGFFHEALYAIFHIPHDPVDSDRA